MPDQGVKVEIIAAEPGFWRIRAKSEAPALLLLAETDAFDLYQHREEDEDLGALELAQTEALA